MQKQEQKREEYRRKWEEHTRKVEAFTRKMEKHLNQKEEDEDDIKGPQGPNGSNGSGPFSKTPPSLYKIIQRNLSTERKMKKTVIIVALAPLESDSFEAQEMISPSFHPGMISYEMDDEKKEEIRNMILKNEEEEDSLDKSYQYQKKAKKLIRETMIDYYHQKKAKLTEDDLDFLEMLMLCTNKEFFNDFTAGELTAKEIIETFETHFFWRDIIEYNFTEYNFQIRWEYKQKKKFLSIR